MNEIRVYLWPYQGVVYTIGALSEVISVIDPHFVTQYLEIFLPDHLLAPAYLFIEEIYLWSCGIFCQCGRVGRLQTVNKMT